MAKINKISNAELIDDYKSKITHPLKEEILLLSEIFRSIDSKIIEQIKWNSLSYFYSGEIKDSTPKEYLRDLAVFNLNKPDYILIVLPNGSLINDDSKLLEGNFKDSRKVIKINSIEQIINIKERLFEIVKILITRIIEN